MSGGVKGATHVYVCVSKGKSKRWEPGCVKIGASRNLQSRMDNLAARLVRSWHLPGTAQLVEYHALRFVLAMPAQGGEWFKIDPDEAVRAVERAIAFVESGRAWISPTMERRRKRSAGTSK